MSDIAISVKGLSKRYLVGHRHAPSERYTALRDVIARSATHLARKTIDMIRGQQIIQGDEIEEFWALRNVSFDIRQGDRIGIIGRNGAGKSTLLKILSRITDPTQGEVRIKGRVASLLEVGTGFHPELTGRENIFLNGAILGMKRSEILQKFDEIVDFAEVEKFLDTPVKRYSSGMYVRLAFAVAAHLEPEILIVDEVLAVGDVAFQKKCLGKMEDISKNKGRTVIFVSHNLDAVRLLMGDTIVLNQGQLVFQGATDLATERYGQILSSAEGKLSTTIRRPTAEKPVVLRDVKLISGGISGAHEHGATIRLKISVCSLITKSNFRIGFTIFSMSGTPVGTAFSPQNIDLTENQCSDICLDIPNTRLAAGHYHFGLSIGQGNHQTGFIDYDILLDVAHFNIMPPTSDRYVEWNAACWGCIEFNTPEFSDQKHYHER